MTQLLDEMLQRMYTENPVGESKLFPGRPKLTQPELDKRYKLKKRLMAAGTGAKGGGKHGGLERISEIVVKQVRRGLQPTIDPETGEVRPAVLGVSVRDGLMAEKMIDTRVNRIDDRKAMLAVAVMLTGGNLEPPPEVFLLEDGNTIEGSYEELDVLEAGYPVSGSRR